MTKRAKEQVDPSAPLDEAGILEGLRRSGYPFEVELLRAFDQNGLDPVNGFRLRVAEGEGRPMRSGNDPDAASSVTREVDVMVNVHVSKSVKVTRADGSPDARNTISARLMGAVEAKSLPSSAAFVGFTFKQPTTFERMGLRCRFAGAPCHGVLPDYIEAQDLALKLAGVLEPINKAPHCVQWAVVARGKDGVPHADHPSDYAAALSNFGRALHLLAIDHTKFVLRSWMMGARFDYFEPTLFIKTPTLWLYDVATGVLTRTPHLTLGQYFEVAGGHQEQRLVDVVSSADVVGFADRYKEVKANLEIAIERNGLEILALAAVQGKRWCAAELQAALQAAGIEY